MRMLIRQAFPASFPILARMALAAGCVLATPVLASPYDALLKARSYQEAERAANAALATNPRDPQALAAKIDAILALAPETRIEEAVSLGETCVAAHPGQSACHQGLGNALGAKAVSASMVSAMGYAGKIRDAFRKAVELDPHNVSARFALQQYYLVAPGIVGGGVDKARTLAQDTAKLSAETGQLMLARVALKEEDFAGAERLARAVSVPAGSKLADERRNTLRNIGITHLSGKRYADSERIFRELQGAYPDSEAGPYWLARVRQEQGKHAEAVPLFEQAAGLYPQAVTYYRLGQSLQASGSKPKALAAYGKALTAMPALPKKLLADANAQIKSLKQQ